MWKSVTLLHVCLLSFFVRGLVGEAFGDGKTWSSDGVEGYLLTDECSVDRIPLRAIEDYLFEAFYLEQKPVIIVGTENERFARLTEKGALLEKYGDIEVTLSSANSISYRKSPKLFRDYISDMKPQTLDRLGNETFYLFGPDKEISEELTPLISTYRRPSLASDDLAFSFGIGPSGSGVPFHIHGHGFNEVVHGRKRWLLYPPDHMPPFNPDASSAHWLKHVYPTLKGGDREKLQDCIIEVGEVLYFPSMWWHSTINIGETVFMSSFDARQVEKQDKDLGFRGKWWKSSVGSILSKEL
ncbi:hypothetical protein BSKO_04058 [Bryopsis sp. KO-2023]|nr:hypothetical protein BSKO_04058 [Bryopsis sp. KO-2023]